MEMEFKTTTGNGKADPSPPPGDGWMLGGSANAPPGFSPTMVFHYWQRPKQHRARECQDCRAVAFINSVCIGCGKLYVEPS